MNAYPLALAIVAAGLLASPARAQTGTAPAEPRVVRDAESCTAGMVEDPVSGVTLAFRIAVDGTGSLRASHRAWVFKPGVIYPIRFVATADPASLPVAPPLADGAAEGFRDPAGRPGVRLSVTRTTAAAMTRFATIAIHGGEGDGRLAMVANQAIGTMDALNGCFDALIVEDIGSGEPVETYPRLAGQAHRLITDNDYPSAALRAGDTGTTRYQLTISAHGLVSGCAIVQSSGSALLDHTSCRLMTRRARFVPARDSDGRATVATMFGNITWKIPDDEPAETAPEAP